MNMRAVLLASAIGLCASAPARGADLATDAKAFGARPAVMRPDLSPDGSSVIYLTPGPGRKTVAVVGDLATGKFSTMVSSDGAPESLQWCHFVGETRAVCRFGGLVESQSIGDLLGFSRLISMDLNGANAKLLGQPESAHEAALRQVDAEVVDWLGGADGTVLMNRLYVPEEVIGTNVKRTKAAGVWIGSMSPASRPILLRSLATRPAT